jgi:hypothetical protein
VTHGVAERVAAFDKLHEEQGPGLRSGAWIVFPDGARREVNPMGALIDPPREEIDRMRARTVYLKIRFEQANSEFNRRKHEIEAVLRSNLSAPGVSNTPASVDEAALVKELEQLRDKAREAHEELRLAQDEIVERMPESDRIRLEKDQDARHAASDALTRVQDIKL